jgi:hypothetical protein
MGVKVAGGIGGNVKAIFAPPSFRVWLEDSRWWPVFTTMKGFIGGIRESQNLSL